ncbi:hypothetical protein SDC9_148759 [bioreactor metagenome]|uniref:Uncharacterized protein n=1 Tax=bioreactor metagenome TaxID=1076179 RepID=A0A645EJQ0_9ZZZZ
MGTIQIMITILSNNIGFVAFVQWLNRNQLRRFKLDRNQPVQVKTIVGRISRRGATGVQISSGIHYVP